MTKVLSILTFLAIAASIVITFTYDVTLGLIQCAVFAVLFIALGIYLKFKSVRLKKQIRAAGKYFENPGITGEFPMPALIADIDGQITWYNEAFEKNVLFDSTIDNANILKLTGGLTPSQIADSTDGVSIEFSDRNYRVYSERFGGEKAIYCLFFIDNTDLVATAKEYKLSRPAVIQMKIDNLDEVYQNYKNSECEVISGEIEHILEAWAVTYPCIFRRNGSGKYLVVMEERGIEMLKENKFNILKQVREYKYGEKPVKITLSIGIGRGATMAECDENSRQALEMSQSRGGDQATINTDGSLEFYGGTITGPAKRTKIKARIIAKSFADHILSADNVFVMGHCFSDLDSIGSAVGIHAIAEALSRPCYIVADKDKSTAKSLIENLSEKTLPEAFVDGNTAGTLVTENSLLVIVDTHRASTLDYPELYEKIPNVIVIDHHRRTADYINNAVLYYDEPSASSASEMVTELLQYVPAKVSLKPLCAEALLSGIMLDTRNFVISTGARTFEAAAYLKEIGADTVSVRQLFLSSFESYKQKNQIVSTAVIYKECAVAVATTHSEDMRIIAAQVANELLNVAGVKSSYVLFSEDDQINISARSLGEMNVQLIMEQLGGGGHLTMAATQLTGMTMGDAVVKLENAINEYTQSINEE